MFTNVQVIYSYFFIHEQLFYNIHKHKNVVTFYPCFFFKNSYVELPKKNDIWPSAELLNFPREIANLHGVYGYRGDNLEWNI